MSMKIYVEAKSKNDINGRLDNNETVTGRNYSMFGGGGIYALDSNLEIGTIIATYTRMVGGNPVSRYYYTWNGTRAT